MSDIQTPTENVLEPVEVTQKTEVPESKKLPSHKLVFHNTVGEVYVFFYLGIKPGTYDPSEITEYPLDYNDYDTVHSRGKIQEVIIKNATCQAAACVKTEDEDDSYIISYGGENLMEIFIVTMFSPDFVKKSHFNGKVSLVPFCGFYCEYDYANDTDRSIYESEILRLNDGTPCWLDLRPLLLDDDDYDNDF